MRQTIIEVSNARSMSLPPLVGCLNDQMSSVPEADPECGVSRCMHILLNVYDLVPT